MTDQSLSAATYPLSAYLLLGQGLMSPRLAGRFGAVTAEQTGLIEGPDRIIRKSVLRQQATGRALLEAQLEIMRETCPPQVIAEMLTTAQLFGAILDQSGVEVDISESGIFRETDADGHLRWGRARRMYRSPEMRLLCTVRELLVPEAELAALALGPDPIP